MIYAEAKEQGYITLRESYERGYISRKSNEENHTIIFDRFGNPYVCIASDKSTRYFVRRYLTK